MKPLFLLINDIDKSSNSWYEWYPYNSNEKITTDFVEKLKTLGNVLIPQHNSVNFRQKCTYDNNKGYNIENIMFNIEDLSFENYSDWLYSQVIEKNPEFSYIIVISLEQGCHYAKYFSNKFNKLCRAVFILGNRICTLENYTKLWNSQNHYDYLLNLFGNDWKEYKIENLNNFRLNEILNTIATSTDNIKVEQYTNYMNSYIKGYVRLHCNQITKSYVKSFIYVNKSNYDATKDYNNTYEISSKPTIVKHYYLDYIEPYIIYSNYVDLIINTINDVISEENTTKGGSKSNDICMMADKLKLLNVRNPIKVAMILHANYQTPIYKYFEQNVKMIGGKFNKKNNNDEDDDTYTFKIGKTSFLFYKVKYDTIIHYSLHRKNDGGLMPECLIILIDIEEKCAVLGGITYHDSCLTTDNKKHVTASGSALLGVAIKFVEKMREKYNIKYFELLDNSAKYCDGVSINFPLMHTFLDGETFYTKGGFLPKKIDTTKIIHRVDNSLVKICENNKKIMDTVITKDTKIKKYLISSHKKIKNAKIDLNTILDLYEEHKDHKLKIFMKEFLKDFNKVCGILDLFIVELANDIGIYDFRGKPFIFVFD